jgi:hypothetical protein
MGISTESIRRIGAAVTLITYAFAKPAIGLERSEQSFPRIGLGETQINREPLRTSAFIRFAGESNGALPTASKEETLASIKIIYEGQGDCDQSLGGDRGITYEDFRFWHEGNKIEFFSNFEVTPSGKKTKWHGVFNPADIGAFLGSHSQDGVLHNLIIKCNNGQECIFDGSWNRTTKEYNIRFCDPSRRDRVARAIKYLQQFYPPSKALPF